MKLVKCIYVGKTTLVRGDVYKVKREDNHKYYLEGYTVGHKKSRFTIYAGDNAIYEDFKVWQSCRDKITLVDTKEEYKETWIGKLFLFFNNLFNGKKENK